MTYFHNIDGLLSRKARKQYRCAGDGSFPRVAAPHAPACRLLIRESEQYVECVWDVGPHESGLRITEECAAHFYAAPNPNPRKETP